jgi:biopolymer transport protein ExbD
MARKPIHRKKQAIAEAEMDITPMIDCTFLLLIFFLVTSKMDNSGAVELPPAKHGGAVVVKDSVVLTVAKAADGGMAKVYKGDGVIAENLIQAATPAEQEERITEWVSAEFAKAGEGGKTSVLVKGSVGVTHGDMDRVYQAAAKAEAPRLAIGILQSE